MATGTSKKRRKTARRGTTARKTTGKRRQKDSMIRREVVILGLFAVSILLLMSNFGVGGVVGGFISDFMFGVFGMFAYVLPVALFLVTAFSISNKENTIAIIKMTAMVVAGILCCCFMQLLTGSWEAGTTAKAFYTYSIQEKRGGGFLGGMLCKMFIGAFGVPGTWILLLVLLVICIVVITERSFISGVTRGGRKVYDSAREDAARLRKRQEEREERRREREALKEEKQISRVEKKVSGVALDTTIREEAVEEVSPLEEEAQEVPKEPLIVPEKEPLPRIHMGEVREITVEEPDLKDLEEFLNIPLHRARTARELSEEREKEKEKEGLSGEVRQAERGQGLEAGGGASKESEAGRQSVAEREPGAGRQSIAEQEPGAGRQSIAEQEPEFEKLLEAGQDSRFWEQTTGSFQGQGEEKAADRFQAPVEEEFSDFLDPTGSGGYGEATAAPEGLEPAMHSVRPAPPPPKPYEFPPISLLKQVKSKANNSQQKLKETAMHLQQILRNFGVGVTVTDVSCGPSVTRYELQPDQGVKVSRIVALSDDIKLNLAVADVRIEAPIPGKAAVGIEVPNAETTPVSQEFQNHSSRIAFAVGKDIAGKTMVADIAKMPHLLIAGATGSGKSVCINTLIMSILYKADPNDVKLIMVDPKVVELSVYNGIPHLLIPVVTDPKKAAAALNWAVAEMTDRYKKFAECNVRNLQGYNEKIQKIADINDPEKPQKLSQIVIIVDELADLMMVASGEVEDAICRLAQLARAAGIHLIIATQRPSVNVITGLIKANMPSRIAFAVSSGVDSRTIIDMNGAEKLLGKGDMLFYPSGLPKPIRVQGAFVSDEEVSAVVDFLSQNNEGSSYSNAVEEHISNVQLGAAETKGDGNGNSGGDGRDVLFAEAGKFIIEKNKASIGTLQRWFKIGFNRAARIMDQLAMAGVVGEEAGTKPREILMTMEEFQQYLEESV